MINLNDYPNIIAALKRAAELQKFMGNKTEDRLDMIINAYEPENGELTENELYFAAAAVKEVELPEYLKNRNK